MSSKGTITGREAFMQHVANRLGRKSPLATAPVRTNQGVPEHYAEIQLTQEENVELFMHNWTALTGKVWVVKEDEAKEAIAACLREVIAELQITRITAWEHEQLAALGLEELLQREGIAFVPWRETAGEERTNESPSVAMDTQQADKKASTQPDTKWAKRSALLQAAESCQLGIVYPDYAIANTGTLALLAHGGKGRSVSLLPGALFAIFRADQLVTRMGEAFANVKRLYPDYQQLPSSLNLITGPSRSADIENDLTIGIHGPGKVYAVIIIPG